MFDMTFAIRTWFNNLPIESRTELFSPVEDTVDRMPVLIHMN